MANLPQFMPEGAPGSALAMGIQAGNAQQNWMDQAQTRQMRQQQMQEQAQQFQTMLPALVAKSQADTATSQATVSSITAQQQARTQYASLIPQATKDLMDYSDMDAAEVQQDDGTPDWQAQYERLESLQAKYSVLGLFPEGSGMLNAINNAAAKAYQMATTQNTLQAHMAMTKEMVEGHQGVAQIQAGQRQQSAQTVANARIQAAQILGQSRLGTANIRSATAAGNTPAAQIQQLETMANQYRTQSLQMLDDPQSAVQMNTMANLLEQRAQTLANPRGTFMTGNTPAPTPAASTPPTSRGSAASPPPSEPNVPQITSLQERDALAPGTLYRDAQGNLRRKANSPISTTVPSFTAPNVTTQ